MLRIAIFASGNGTNAENIISYFQNSNLARVVLVLSNNKNAKVLKRAKHLNVSVLYFSRNELYASSKLITLLQNQADLLVLAGFMWRIPAVLIQEFPNKIINIHPALLPKYGGKGMYGMHVHNAVKENNEKETGISIHYVNEKYDEGAIIFQKKVPISPTDSPEQIAAKIHKLEYKYFPIVIENLLNTDFKIDTQDH